MKHKFDLIIFPSKVFNSSLLFSKHFSILKHDSCYLCRISFQESDHLIISIRKNPPHGIQLHNSIILPIKYMNSVHLMSAFPLYKHSSKRYCYLKMVKIPSLRNGYSDGFDKYISNKGKYV